MAAGPKHVTPSKVVPSRQPRRFTLAEANASLPYVKRVVGDIVRVHGQSAAMKGQADRVAAKDQAKAQAELDASERRLHDLLDELADVGCSLKDPQQGLVDFTGRHDGHDVCLCWKLGEERIAFWHESSTGFTGRQPVSKLRES